MGLGDTRELGDLGLGDLGLGDLGLGYLGLGDLGLGTRGLGTRGLGTRGHAGTRGRDKQTTPNICAEFVEYNFRWSHESYFMLESLLVVATTSSLYYWYVE